MSAREPVIPALTVTTVEVPGTNWALTSLPPRQQLLWLRRGEGMMGFGCAARLEFTGSSRLADASERWSRVAAESTVDDEVRIPGSGLIAFGTFAFADNSSATSVLHIPSLVVGNRNGRSWLTRIQPADASDHDVPPPRALPAAKHVNFASGSLSPDAYLDAVHQAIDIIDRGDLSKVVLARDLIGHVEAPVDTAATLTALADNYPDCWTFAVDDFLGSSPETLVAVTNQTVTARVLAGSGARGTDAASDEHAAFELATSTKDQDEHQYAVRSVLAALRPHSANVTASENPFTLRLPNLWHLATDVEGTLDDGSTSLDLAAALHPTAAVAGTPTPDAVELIDRLEPFDRGRYAGPVGWIGEDGDGEWAIALRCAQLEPDGTVRAFAGAGIVSDSVPEHELAETSLKFRPIVEAFT